jgi:hypothetical protein
MRDLAIDYLQGHPAERLEFLFRTDDHGLLLAISTSGGELGGRSLPLLRTDEDWGVLGQRAGELVAESSPARLSNILTSVHSLLQHEQTLRDAGVKEHANALAKTILENVRLRWNASKSDIGIRQLRTYFELTVLVRPLLPSPDLEPTWARWDFTQTILAREVAFDETQLNQLGWWLALVGLLSTWEPRWLLVVGFSGETRGNVLEALIGQLAAFVDELEDLEEEDRDPETGEPADPDLQECEERQALGHLVDDLDMLLILVRDDVKELCRSASRAAREHLYVRGRRAELREEFESYEPDPVEDSSYSSAASDTQTVFSVDAVFSDL